MPATSYDKTISGDFSGNLRSGKLHQEILDSSIVTALDRIDIEGNNVKIWFVDALSGGDQTTLNNLISAHDGVLYVEKKRIRLTLAGSGNGSAIVSSATYTVRSRFVFPGTNEVGVPSAIKAICWRDNSNQYDIKIHDVTNGNDICELTGQTNTSPELKNLGTLSNLPKNEAIFELQLRRDTGFFQYARCSEVIIEF